MPDRYCYLTADGGPEQAHALAGELAGAGAVVVGAWSGAGGIGWWSDEVAVLAGVPDGVALDALDALDVGTAGAQPAQATSLEATSRPTSIEPLGAGGVFAHRWFELAEGDVEEFLALSTGAWPSFEAAYGAAIEGLFLSRDTDPPDARALLVTRYPSLAVWEASRGSVRTTSGEAAEAGRRFIRRHQLTRRTVVRVGTLIDLPRP